MSSNCAPIQCEATSEAFHRQILHARKREERERPRCRDVAKDDWRCVDADGREGNKGGRKGRERGWNCMAFAERAGERCCR